MTEIKYSPEILKIVSEFSKTLQKEILFRKEDGNIVVGAFSKDAIVTFLKTKEENLNFDGDHLAFIDFPNFSDYVSMLKNPKLMQSENKIVLVKDKTKINYLLTDRTVIEKSQRKKVNFGEATHGLAIDDTKFDEIKNLVLKMGIDNIRFTFEGKKCSFLLFKDNNENSSEIEFDLEESCDHLEFEIKSTFFKLAPSLPYTIDINPATGIRFSYANDLYNLDLYTTAVITD